MPDRQAAFFKGHARGLLASMHFGIMGFSLDFLFSCMCFGPIAVRIGEVLLD